MNLREIIFYITISELNVNQPIILELQNISYGMYLGLDIDGDVEENNELNNYILNKNLKEKDEGLFKIFLM